MSRRESPCEPSWGQKPPPSRSEQPAKEGHASGGADKGPGVLGWGLQPGACCDEALDDPPPPPPTCALPGSRTPVPLSHLQEWPTHSTTVDCPRARPSSLPLGKYGQPGFLLGQGRIFVEEVHECSRASSQAPPTSACLPRGWLTLSPSLGGGCFLGMGPGAPQSLHRGSCSLKPLTQGRGRAGAWQAFAGEMLEECVWWGPRPMERSQGPGGLVVTASSSRRADRWGPGSPRTMHGEPSPPWGPGHPAPP